MNNNNNKNGAFQFDPKMTKQNKSYFEFISLKFDF